MAKGKGKIPVMTSTGKVKEKAIESQENEVVMKSTPIPDLNGSNLDAPIESVGKSEKSENVDKIEIVLDNKLSPDELNEVLKRDDAIFKFNDKHPVVLTGDQQTLLRMEERQAYKIAWDVFNAAKGAGNKRNVAFVDILGDGATARLKPKTPVKRGMKHVWVDPVMADQYEIAGYVKTGEILKSSHNRDKISKPELVGMLVPEKLYDAIQEGNAFKSQERLGSVNDNAESEIKDIAGTYSNKVSIYERGKLVKD